MLDINQIMLKSVHIYPFIICTTVSLRVHTVAWNKKAYHIPSVQPLVLRRVAVTYILVHGNVMRQ